MVKTVKALGDTVDPTFRYPAGLDTDLYKGSKQFVLLSRCWVNWIAPLLGRVCASVRWIKYKDVEALTNLNDFGRGIIMV